MRNKQADEGKRELEGAPSYRCVGRRLIIVADLAATRFDRASRDRRCLSLRVYLLRLCTFTRAIHFSFSAAAYKRFASASVCGLSAGFVATANFSGGACAP